MAKEFTYSNPATAFLDIPHDLIGVYAWLLAMNRENHNPDRRMTDELAALEFDAVVRQCRIHKEHLPKLPKGRTARDLANWTYSAIEKLFAEFPTIPAAVEVQKARDTISWVLMQTVSPLSGGKKPLTQNEWIIYAKLRSLPPEKGMTEIQLLDWLSAEHGQNIDGKTLRNRFIAIEPFGLDNRHGAGYYIKR
jgi:hypothetical protein